MSEINGAHHDISGDTDTRYSGRFTKGLPPKDAKCHPKCLWKCGGGCDQVCTPVCAPPKCETSCPPLESEGCHMQCGPPKCAVVVQQTNVRVRTVQIARPSVVHQIATQSAPPTARVAALTRSALGIVGLMTNAFSPSASWIAITQRSAT